MKHGSLFSGVGGFDLAAEWMGWDNLFHCEWNPFGQKVLKYYWPNAESFTDITKTDFTPYANRIDVLTGGFPCQPYSAAGKRLGTEDDRHLWPEMLRAIREISPRWIVGENVRGLTDWNGGMVFDEVQAQMETEGYEVLPFLLPACAVNAPHRRDRIWFIAHAKDVLYQRDERKLSTQNGRPQFNNLSSSVEPSSELCQAGLIANSNHTGIQGWQTSGNLESERQEAKQFIGRHNQRNDWHVFPTVSPLRDGDDGISSGLDTSAISVKNWIEESIKAGGNAIVPQVAYEIFKAIEAYEQTTTKNKKPHPL